MFNRALSLISVVPICVFPWMIQEKYVHWSIITHLSRSHLRFPLGYVQEIYVHRSIFAHLSRFLLRFPLRYVQKIYVQRSIITHLSRFLLCFLSNRYKQEICSPEHYQSSQSIPSGLSLRIDT